MTEEMREDTGSWKESLSDIRDELDALWSQRAPEAKEWDPGLEKQLQTVFQNIATQLQQKISKTWSSNEQYNDQRGDFTVDLDKAAWRYHFTMESFGITTKFKFVPEAWPSGTWRLVLYHGMEETEYMSVSISGVKETATIEKFLWWVNSANKEFALCEDYTFLQELPRLLDNPANQSYYAWYLERYKTIMAQQDFSKLQFAGWSISTSRPIIDWKGKKASFMNARWDAVKARMKPALDQKFKQKKIAVDQ